MIGILRIDGIDKELNYFCSADKCSCHTAQIGKSNYQQYFSNSIMEKIFKSSYVPQLFEIFYPEIKGSVQIQVTNATVY